MLYEINPGVYINLRQLVRMEVRSNKSIVLWDSNKTAYTKNFENEDEMDMIRMEIESAIMHAYRLK